MNKKEAMIAHLNAHSRLIAATTHALSEVTVEVEAKNLSELALVLRDDPALDFSMLVDVCGVDYLDYGVSQWLTEAATVSGFSRAVELKANTQQVIPWNKPRFAVVYHLLSLQKNQRIRMKCFVEEESLMVDSLIGVWSSANWFEREAFDLYGIMFKGHPDLRRILTDYGFIGHPFRKDFPVSGHVEMRYDAKTSRVVYEPVLIEPRVLVPKVIRDDNRYKMTSQGGKHV